jgi:tetratricopeptide (TPR) repeat protein
LRNLETGNLTIEDLRNVASLAAYWDTLGWVYYQKGDLDSAEKYIKASWAIQQHSEVGHHIGAVAEKRGKKDDAIRLYAQGAVADRLRPEARESLLKLVKPDALDGLLQNAKKELSAYQTLALPQLMPDLNGAVEAEFYLLLAPDASRNAQVVDVKFIKGEEKLKALASQLKSIKYPLVFPDASPTKVVRRGALRCEAKPGACTFTMISPDVIVSVD